MENLAKDILRGAAEIAEFVFGDPAQRRRVYHLSERGEFPVFRMGSQLCARRSTVLAWIEEKEAQSGNGE